MRAREKKYPSIKDGYENNNEGKKTQTHLKFGHRAVNLLWLYHKLVPLMWKSGFSFECETSA